MEQTISKLSLLFFFLPGIALAHTGAGQTTGFMYGFGHPIGGADHMLAMVAVGLWAAQIGGRALWIVPGTFVGVMLIGGILGFTGIPVPFVEEGILVSILILGILIVGAFKLPLAYSSMIVGLFAVFHGHAHGAEMPETLSAAWYAVGFALATMRRLVFLAFQRHVHWLQQCSTSRAWVWEYSCKKQICIHSTALQVLLSR